jgi:hypothetical protein
MLLLPEEQASESRRPSNNEMLIRKSGVSFFKGMCTLYSNIIEGVRVWL